MRRIVFTLGVFLILHGVAAAEQTVVVMPEENYRTIIDQLGEMQRRIDTLEGRESGAPVAPAPAMAPSSSVSSERLDSLSQDISIIYDTLDLVETKTLLDRLNFGVELRTRVDNWKVKDFWRLNDQIGYMTTLTWMDATGAAIQTAMTNGDNDRAQELMAEMPALLAMAGNYTNSQLVDEFGNPLAPPVPSSNGTYVPAGFPVPIVRNESNDNSWTNRFRLNMGAGIAKGLKFSGRLTVYKDWATSDSPFAANDANRAHVPGGTEIKLDRAYVDWIPDLPIPLAFTFGRQPSSEGPGNEFKENKKRQSTYPALIFDGESDGIVTTLGLERYTGLKNSGTRFYYAKGFQSNDEYSTFLDNFRQDLTDTNVYGFFLESEIPGIPRSLVSFSYVRGNDFPDMFENKIELGDMDLIGLHAQAGNFMGIGLDVFASFGANLTRPNGNIYQMTAQNPTDGTIIKNPDGSGANLTVPFGGLFTNPERDATGQLIRDANGNPMGSTKKQTGWAFYAGARYTLPFEVLNKAKIGFEVNHGSKYWFSYTWGSSELFNKLATRGNVYDIYYIQPFGKHLFMRTGYTMVDYDYTGSGMHLGAPMESDTELSNFYVLIDTRF